MPIEQVVNDDASGVGSGWKLAFYVSGTTTPKDTFSDSALTTANANPVVADSAGRFGNIFLESGTYKVILSDADDVEKWTADPVEGPLGSSGAVDEVSGDYTITLGDATKLLAVDASGGPVTITLLPAATATDGYEITVKKVDNSANTVTIDGNGAETIDEAAALVLTTQQQGVTLRSDAANWQKVAQAFETLSLKKGDDVASANALTLGSGNYFDITGTTAITSVGTKGVGTTIRLHFDDALVLTHHATDLILPGAANITTAAGDEAEFFEYATGDWRCTAYQRADGTAVVDVDADPITIGTEVGISSGTSIELASSLPTGIKRVTIAFVAVSSSSTDEMKIQIGDAVSGLKTSGYLGGSSYLGTGGSTQITSRTDGFGISSSHAASAVYHGLMTMVLEDVANNTWVASCSVSRPDGQKGFGDGSVSLDGPLDRISIAIGGGAFDGGSVNILYETA